MSQPKQQTLSACVSEFVLAAWSGDFEIDGFGSLSVLRNDPADPDARAKRGEMIEALRGGKHIELKATATTFTQSKKPNRRYLRLDGDIEAQVKTFARMPYLVDHNVWEKAARKGTILSSKAIEDSANSLHFSQQLHVTKPDGVISILDGTTDKFSIGWHADGPVMCSVHGVDVRSSSDSCYCWPGGMVKIDGKDRLVEYIFTKWTGKEVSDVNSPAASGTGIEDVRSALSAELGLPTNNRVAFHVINKEQSMRFAKLAAVLGLAAQEELDEGRATAAAENLVSQNSELRADKERLTRELSDAKAAAGLAAAAGLKIQADALIDGAYREGKLRKVRDELGNEAPSPREARLRRIAAEPDGIGALRAEIADMEKVVPVRQSQASTVTSPGIDRLGEGEGGDGEHIDADDITLGSEVLRVAKQMNLKPEEVKAYIASRMNQGGY